MIDAIQTVLNKILIDHPPKNVLCMGQGTGNAIKEYLSQHTDCHMIQINLDGTEAHKALELLNTHDIFEFGVVANSIEYLDKASASHLLARLRDIYTKKLLVVVPIGNQWKGHTSHWEETDMLALGFTLKARITVDEKPVHVYAFDITFYKTTPDWLNNKYWANPELWDKHWW
jgi:hypothetical protein